jgi:hypothetical protein
VSQSAKPVQAGFLNEAYSVRIAGRRWVRVYAWAGVGRPGFEIELYQNLGGFWQYAIVRYERLPIRYIKQQTQAESSPTRRVVFSISGSNEYATQDEAYEVAKAWVNAVGVNEC